MPLRQRRRPRLELKGIGTFSRLPRCRLCCCMSNTHTHTIKTRSSMKKGKTFCWHRENENQERKLKLKRIFPKFSPHSSSHLSFSLKIFSLLIDTFPLENSTSNTIQPPSTTRPQTFHPPYWYTVKLFLKFQILKIIFTHFSPSYVSSFGSAVLNLEQFHYFSSFSVFSLAMENSNYFNCLKVFSF